jgi:PKD repeat protein
MKVVRLIALAVRAVLHLAPMERRPGTAAPTARNRVCRRNAAGVLAAIAPALVAVALVFASPGAAVAGSGLPDCSNPDVNSNPAAECIGTTPVVPSLDPEWSATFVPPPLPKVRSLAACRPVSVVFYTPTDWFRVAQKMRGNPSACGDYYFSVPPLAADKTQMRANEAARIRGLGTQIHAVADITVTNGWAKWVADGNGSWFDAGVEARRRMVAVGYDFAAGDLWAVNELNSNVRTGVGTPSRADMLELIRGLYTGDGTGPTVPGLVWTVGIGQTLADTSTYKTALKGWYQDAAFWTDMPKYVRFWSQEAYADIRKWGVPGTDLATRRDRLTEYLQHVNVLAQVSPPEVAGVKSLLESADAPLATSVWAVTSGFGYTLAPVPQMQAFVASQVYAFRHYQGLAPYRDADSFGFAWSPNNNSGLGLTGPEFTAQSATILDRLAASIHASETSNAEDPGVEACGPDGSWCAADIDGASFNLAWQAFGTWSQPLASDSTASVTEDTPAGIPLVASDADGDPLTYELVTPPGHGSLTGEDASRTYTPEANFNGTDSFRFRVSDGVMSSRTATVAITVTAVNDPPTLELAAAGPVDEGSSVTLTAHATDVEGDAVTFTWATDVGTVGQVGEPGTFAVSDTVTFAAADGPATAHVTVTGADGNGGNGSAAIDVEVLNVAPSAEAGPAATAHWGFPAALTGSATDPSPADASAGFGWSWDFGDGSPAATGKTVLHVYADPGTYTAALTVTDANGDTGVDTTRVTVEYTKQITGVLKGPFRVAAGQSVLLGPGADIQGPVTVEAGGAIDVGAANIAGFLRARGAASIRLCGAMIGGPFDAIGGGPVLVGDGSSSCGATTFAGPVTLQDNAAAVQIVGAVVNGPLRVIGNSGATVTGNTVYGPLTVAGNRGIVVDRPNIVSGPSTLQ